MRVAHRWTVVGLLVGVAIALWVTLPQVRADLAGQPIMGPGEVMVVLSLPVSVVTWGLMILVTPTSGQVPGLAAYLWLVLTPILNWTLLGWLLDRWGTRRGT